MTSSSSKFNFVFEYSILTKALGPLDFRTLKTIKDELKTNAACIDSDLGGGAHGHLGLILDSVEYDKVATGTPYIRHTMPAAISFANNTPQHEVTRRRDDFKEEKRLFKEMIALEKSLLQQLSNALPTMYLKRFRSKDSNAIDKPISFIMSHLFLNYGSVTEEQLLDEEAKLRAKVFDLTEPLILMYNEVDDLVDLAIAAKIPYTEHQIVSLGLTLIKNTNDFETGITDWIKKTTTKDWDAFKIHFEIEQENLRTIRGPTMRSSVLTRQANAMQAEREQYVNVISAAEHRIMTALDSHPPALTSETESSSVTSVSPVLTTPAANITTTDTIMLEVLKLLKDIKEDKKQPRNRTANNSRKKTYDNKENDAPPKSTYMALTRQQKRKRADEEFEAHSIYCHTHGACTHTSKACKWPKSGHKKEATFKNMMGGSTAYCQQCS